MEHETKKLKWRRHRCPFHVMIIIEREKQIIPCMCLLCVLMHYYWSENVNTGSKTWSECYELENKSSLFNHLYLHRLFPSFCFSPCHLGANQVGADCGLISSAGVCKCLSPLCVRACMWVVKSVCVSAHLRRYYLLTCSRSATETAIVCPCWSAKDWPPPGDNRCCVWLCVGLYECVCMKG